MKQILLPLKELNKHLSFLRKSFTKCGFRHVLAYINGLISVNKKTVKQISKASIQQISESSLNRLLHEARIKQEYLEERYLKKIVYLTKGQEISLIYDDTLVKREGKKVEEAQKHKNHSGKEKFIIGHQFFTSIIHTPFLHLPLLPKLYSKNTDSKIQMALDLLDFIIEKVPLDNVIMDSWYSDKRIIKKCMNKHIRVLCVIKTNRKVRLKGKEWKNLSKFSRSIPEKEFQLHFIDENEYEISEHLVRLNRIPFVKMITSKRKEGKKYKKSVHLISTRVKDSAAQIIRRYATRWVIETYHWNIKQNLGFAKLFLRKKEAIVRHAIFSSLAYTAVKLYMFLRGIDKTVGECITQVENEEMDGFMLEIIEVEDKEERVRLFEETFIRRTGEV